MSIDDLERLRLPVDDGLAMRPSGLWVKEKLYYLKRYIYAFETAMRDKPWRSRFYIDLFAGPGKCFIRETNEVVLGSPLLALSADYPFTDYFFADLDEDNIDCLSRRASSYDIDSIPDIRHGDSNQLVYEIVETIHRRDAKVMHGTWSSLNLAFLDPAGISLERATVEALATVSKMDMIIHYPRMGLNRPMKLFYESEKDSAVDRFFGDREWREIYSSLHEQGARESHIHRELRNHYIRKLADFGYVFNTSHLPEPLVRSTNKNSPLYNLILVSKNELAYQLWGKIGEIRPDGQIRMNL